eukprot:1334934-Amorphochlora_amoeboformis.AAC.1
MDAGPKDISEGKYGIYVAQLAGFPASIIKGALKIHSALQKSSNEKISAEDETERRHKLLEALEAIKHTTLPLETLQQYLRQLHKQYVLPGRPVQSNRPWPSTDSKTSARSSGSSTA